MNIQLPACEIYPASLAPESGLYSDDERSEWISVIGLWPECGTEDAIESTCRAWDEWEAEEKVYREYKERTLAEIERKDKEWLEKHSWPWDDDPIEYVGRDGGPGEISFGFKFTEKQYAHYRAEMLRVSGSHLVFSPDEYIQHVSRRGPRIRDRKWMTDEEFAELLRAEGYAQPKVDVQAIIAPNEPSGLLASIPAPLAEIPADPQSFKPDVPAAPVPQDQLLVDAVARQKASDNIKPLSNAIVEDFGDGANTIPLPINEILKNTLDRSGGWPHRVDSGLFVHVTLDLPAPPPSAPKDLSSGPIYNLKNSTEMFAWLQRNFGVVEWWRNTGCVTKEEFFESVKAVAPYYPGGIEHVPHFPPIPGVYYACHVPECGDGNHFTALLDMFAPATTIDRQLIRLLFATALWGGPAGSRPMFAVTSKDGRGVGKSKLTEMVSRLLDKAQSSKESTVVSGMSRSSLTLEISYGEDLDRIKTRILSPEGVGKRLVRLDNLKASIFSSQGIESIVTAPRINGHKLYVGDASRDNHLLWMLTVNGIALSTDIAQRSVVIHLEKPKRSGNWENCIVDFIERNRNAIIGDIRGYFELPINPLRKHSRWATWERECLCRLPNPDTVQSTILDRQLAADADAEEIQVFEDHMHVFLQGLEYEPEYQRVEIPCRVAARCYQDAVGEKISTIIFGKKMKQWIEEGVTERLSAYRRKYDRGYIWEGKHSVGENDTLTEPERDLEERIRTRKPGFDWK